MVANGSRIRNAQPASLQSVQFCVASACVSGMPATKNHPTTAPEAATMPTATESRFPISQPAPKPNGPQTMTLNAMSATRPLSAEASYALTVVPHHLTRSASPFLERLSRLPHAVTP
jgi:hypothetical protein